MILVIDNYDSFVHNLARYFRQLGCETVVLRNDKITVNGIKELAPKAIIISPGPCSPNEAGCSIEVIQQFGNTIPILGICLGHQAIVQAYGGEIVRGIEPVHGRQSQVKHTSSKMFNKVPSPFAAGRYHSLVAHTTGLPPQLNATAKTEDGTIMAVEHESSPVIGLQFHPESILTQSGHQLLINFLTIADIEIPNPECQKSEFSGELAGVDWFAPKTISSGRLSRQELP